jgi:hypothetical protein
MGFWSGIADAFSRDGGATRFCEKLPVIGHVTAGIQLLAGNPEHAKRAAATATNSTLTAGGAVAGFMVGGPLGAAGGAALASTAGIACEYGISTTIDDQNVKGNVGEVSIKRIVVDGALSSITAVIPGGTAVIGSAGKEVAKQSISSAVKTGVLTGLSTYAISKNSPTTLANQTQCRTRLLERPSETCDGRTRRTRREEGLSPSGNTWSRTGRSTPD